MLGCTSTYPDPPRPDKSESRVVYLHGYVSSRILRMAKSAQNDSDEEQSTTHNNGPSTSDSHQTQESTNDSTGNGNNKSKSGGIPLCICATLLDGLVLALTPNHHSCNYRSALLFGHAHLVTSPPERLHAMAQITNTLVPHRWSQTRYPSPTELSATGILRVEISSASAKIRKGTTGEDRKDLADVRMREQVWAGVVPAYLKWGSPVESETNLRKGVPGYIGEWVEGENGRNERYAYEAAR